MKRAIKNKIVIFCLALLFYSSSILPVRPITVKAAVSAMSILAGVNASRSYKKRTAAIQQVEDLGSEARRREKRKMVIYTGGAILLGLGATAAVGICLIENLPAVRVRHARRIYDKLQVNQLLRSHQLFDLPLDHLRYNRALLRHECREVRQAGLDFEKDNLAQESRDALFLGQELQLALEATHEQIEALERLGRKD